MEVRVTFKITNDKVLYCSVLVFYMSVKFFSYIEIVSFEMVEEYEVPRNKRKPLTLGKQMTLIIQVFIVFLCCIYVYVVMLYFIF